MSETQSKNISNLLSEIFIFSATFKAEILERSAELDDNARERLAAILKEAIDFQKEEIKKRQAEDPDFASKVKEAVSREHRKKIAVKNEREAALSKTKVNQIIKRIKSL